MRAARPRTREPAARDMARFAYRFRPRWLTTLAAVALLALFARLGIWQLHRATSMQALQAEYDARERQPPVALSAQTVGPKALRYHRVVARGRYDSRYQILIDNRVHKGVPGYEVITPLHLDGGRTRVLVNRGWVPLGEDRSKLPVVSPPPGEQRTEGVAVVPDKDYFSLGEPDAHNGWSVVWEHLDVARYARHVPFPVQPVVVQLAPGADGGYVRDWRRPDTDVAMHKGYAFQWFMFAAVLVVLYVMLNLEKTDKSK